jgi:PAS domain S-box-containing protein
LGIFTVGAIVAIATILPFYQHLKKDKERDLEQALSSKTALVEEYLFRARDTALQISSRTAAREKLEAYLADQATLQETTDATVTVLSDAMSVSQEVWGIIRLDAERRVIAQIGIDLPEQSWPSINPKQNEVTFSGPITLNDKPYLLIVSPIFNREFKRIGTDILLFRLFHFERIVADVKSTGSGSIIIAKVADNKIDTVFPFDSAQLPTINPESLLGRAIIETAIKKSGILFPSATDPDHIIAYGPIGGSNWGMVVLIERQELYAPIYRYMTHATQIIIVLIMLGTSIMMLAVRPLTGKMIVRAGELEKEVQAKTEDLQRELTGRKRMEQWLMDSERRYRTLLAEVPDVIFILDEKGRFSYVNTQIEKFLELPVYQILETGFLDHMADESKDRAGTLFSVDHDEIWDEEISMITANGETKYARVRCKSSYTEHGVRYEGVMRDITRRKDLEQELKHSRAALIEKIKIIDDLYEHIVQTGKSKAIADHTAEVAHELRQPLAIIGGFARRIARQFDSCEMNGDNEQKESCSIMISEVQRLERILTSLLQFSRHESIRLEAVDPNALIERVIRVHEGRIQDKNLRIEAQLGKEIGDILLDPDRFEQVVRNLISNAIEASPGNSVMGIETGVLVPGGKAQETGELASEPYFEMKIRNYGKVIPPEDLQKLFSPFFTTKEYGTGIGLTISKRIIEDHGGSISVKSDADGTVFTVWIPMHAD